MAELRAEMDRIFRATSPYRVVTGPEQVTDAERLRMANRHDAAKRETREVEASILERRRSIALLVEADRERQRAEIKRKKLPILNRLARKLAEAAAANAELMALEEQEDPTRGAVRLAWPDLGPSTPLATNRIDAWREFARSEGYDIEDAGQR